MDATTRRGVLKAFDGGTYKASVQVAGSLAVWLDDVAVSRAISAGEMQAGRSVALVFFDASNPNDGVVVAVWG